MDIDVITLTASKNYTDKQIEKASIKGADLSGYLQRTELTGAISTALAQAKASGEFKGEAGKDGADGKDYVLTDDDLDEIAERAAELVEVPEGGGSGGVTSGWKKVYEYVWDANNEYQPLTLDFATGVMTFDNPPKLEGGYRIAPNLQGDSTKLEEAFGKIPNEFIALTYDKAMEEVEGGYRFGGVTTFVEGGVNTNVDINAFRFERPKTSPNFTGLNTKKVMVKSRGSGVMTFPSNYGWGFNIALSNGKTVPGGSIWVGESWRAWEETTQTFIIDNNGVLSTTYEVMAMTPSTRTNSGQNFRVEKNKALINVYSLPDDVTITGLSYAGGSGNFGPANGVIVEVYVYED